MKNLALMWVLAACLLGCDGKPPVSTFTDTRDGKTYKIVKIGSQTWFAENLNYAVEGSKCYGEGDTVVLGDGQYYTPKKTLSPDEVQTNCAKYGRLYTWEAALKACPAGTHLPTNEEWATLVDYVGGDSTAGIKLKSSTGWRDKGNGTNDYGFSAIPGGRVDSDGRFDNVGYFDADDIGYWWNDMEDNDNPAGVIIMNYIDIDNLNKEVIRSEGDNDETNLFSVRCVKD